MNDHTGLCGTGIMVLNYTTLINIPVHL